jgi:hypothetical protein
MPSRYEKSLPKFTGSDEENVENLICEFYDFFQLHTINDDTKYLAMKLFSATLHDNSRRWYDDLPESSFTSMDTLEKVFLKRWNIKEDPMVFLNKHNHINKNENETIREFHIRFQKLLQQLPKSHRHVSKFLFVIYIRDFSGKSIFFIDIRRTRTIREAYDISMKVESNVFSSKVEQSFSPEVNIGEPKYTLDIRKRIPCLETPIDNS